MWTTAFLTLVGCGSPSDTPTLERRWEWKSAGKWGRALSLLENPQSRELYVGVGFYEKAEVVALSPNGETAWTTAISETRCPLCDTPAVNCRPVPTDDWSALWFGETQAAERSLWRVDPSAHTSAPVRLDHPEALSRSVALCAETTALTPDGARFLRPGVWEDSIYEIDRDGRITNTFAFGKNVTQVVHLEGDEYLVVLYDVLDPYGEEPHESGMVLRWNHRTNESTVLSFPYLVREVVSSSGWIVALVDLNQGKFRDGFAEIVLSGNHAEMRRLGDLVVENPIRFALRPEKRQIVVGYDYLDPDLRGRVRVFAADGELVATGRVSDTDIPTVNDIIVSHDGSTVYAASEWAVEAFALP
ncbi:hypothetical protein AKJ08_1521 [Vulgatibacter incomptus]|uniref:Uncharacterized protein n=1 Tax=Vulgatibacter incomptus TaxID=1391653 RepID=A0A0K1PDE0_9BACT|nr:hypothetical protein AKJ08_1521 [Vulgatibacter incomptus]